MTSSATAGTVLVGPHAIVATMRVLHVVKGLGPGGAERLLVSLAAARGADTAFGVAYVLARKGHLVAELEATGATAHLLAGRLGLADLRWPARLVALVRSTRPDVVHLHSPAVASVARPLLHALPGRPRIVSSEHNLWPSFGAVTRVANGLTLPLADECLAVSEEVLASVWSRHRHRLDVVVQGVPIAALVARRTERVRAREALGLAHDDVLVMTVANFREKKDYPTLLRAAAACADEPHLRFVSIGQGPLESELHEVHRQLGLGERFRFLGYHPDPPAVVAGADLFALSSRHEGLPIALLEAMALGVVPVASAVGGIPEVITDGIDGVLTPPGDPLALAQILRDLADDPDRRRALASATVRRAQHFDVARTQQELEARYRRLINATRGD